MRLESLIDGVSVVATDGRENLSIGLLASGEGVRNYALWLGLFGLITGFLLLLSHKRTFDEAMLEEDSERVRSFEARSIEDDPPSVQ